MRVAQAESHPPITSPAGEVFPAFPFPPYSIQLGFMRALYRALEQGGVGLFESPTGAWRWARAGRATSGERAAPP